MLNALSDDEIRALAVRFAAAERYGASIKTIAVLARRPGFKLTRSDMKLLYPQAFPREISEAASRWSIPEELLFGLVRTESAFIPDVVSNAGAEGLAQLMRPTAKDVAARLKGAVELKYAEGEIDLSDPYTNVQLGGWYLANLNERLGSPLLSLFAYNGGISRVRKWRASSSALPEDLFLETVPFSETRDYGRKVLAAAAVYGYLYRGKPLPRVVDDFFPALSHSGTRIDR
jgi:soluble lytic murein transglycosylase